MIWLVLGVVLWSAAHFLPITRARVRARAVTSGHKIAAQFYVVGASWPLRTDLREKVTGGVYIMPV